MLCPMCQEKIDANTSTCPYCAEDIDEVWRNGNVLIMKKDAELPDRCIKCNLPAETHIRRDLFWHANWVYFLVFLSPLIYIVVALLVRKTAKIEIGLTHACAKKRRTAILIAWLLALAGLGVIIGGFSTLKGDAPLYTMFTGIVVMIAGAVWGVVGARLISVSEISHDYIWIKGVCPDYLDELPEWN